MLVEDFDVYLAAVRVAGDGEIVTLPGCHRKDIWIVREQDVDGAGCDQDPGGEETRTA